MESRKINEMMLGNKVQGKHEQSRLLTVETDLFLPPEKKINIYLIR